MKPLLPYRIFLLILFLALAILPGGGYAQRSAAELISTVPPPEGNIKYRDGVRQITLLNNYLLVTNFWAGLQVVDISDVRNPRQIAFLPTYDQAYGTTVDSIYAYLANDASGVIVFDIRDLNRVSKAAEILPPGNAYWAVAEFPYLFVALGDGGFAIMDITDFDNPITIKLEIPGEWVQQLFKKDTLLYLAAKTGGLIIYDVSEPANPRKLSQYRTNYNTMMVQVVDSVAFLADGAGGMLALDVANPRSPVALKRFSGIGFVGALYKAGNYVYLANREVGLQIVNVTDPAKPFLESRYDTEDINYGVYKKDIYVFLAANVATLIMRHNNAPLLEDIPDLNLQENALFSLQLKAHEPDGDAIVYEIINLPEGASFDSKTGYFSWTPTYEQSGNYPNVIFRVIEQTATHLSAVDTVTILVEHVNRLPDLPTLANTTVNENNLLTFTIPQGSDPDKEDQNRLAYRAEKLPTGATFDPATRTFSWTPTFEQSGAYVVDFLIDDGAGGIDREPVTITVSHVDRKPEIAALARQTVNEAQPLTLTISGSEPDREDQDKISFKMENLPAGALFDPASRVFTWTPSHDQSGTYNTIKAIMIAGNLSDTTTLALAVNHVNRPPALDPVSDQIIAENQLLTFTVSGSDPDVEDAGKLLFSAANLPEGAVFNPSTRTFSWTPGFDQSRQYPEVAFTVSDPAGLTDTKTITLTVGHVNRPPAIVQMENKAVAENQLLEFQLSSSDPDREDTEKLVFSAANLPEGATLDSKSGLFRWIPSFDQSGEYRLSFMISDGQYSDTTVTAITVGHVNRAPVLEPVAAQIVDENQPLTFTISGMDSDREDAGLLNFSATNLPAGAVFDPATRTVAWTPTYEQSGQYQLSFEVKDPSGLFNQVTVPVAVNHVNRPPSLEPVLAQAVDENQPLSIQLVGADPDREDAGKLTYTAESLPAGAQIDPVQGILAWTPSYEQAGQYTATVMVSDPSGLSARQTVAITVNHVNRPPALEPLPVQAGSENTPLLFAVKASDPDAEDAGKLIYVAGNLPPGSTLNEKTGEFAWTPTFIQSGEYAVSIQVSDSYGASVSETVNITIAHVNRPPTLPAVAGATFRENSPASLVIPEGEEPDGEDAGKLAYAIENLPAGAAFDPQTRTLSWTPTFEQSGEYPLVAMVRDPDGLSASQMFNLVVEHVNRPPQFAAMAKQTGPENSLLQFTFSFSDPDREDAGKLAFRSDNLPQGASLDPASGTFSWTPSYEQSGVYQVSATASDPGGETAAGAVEIEITHVNRPPLAPDAPVYTFQEETPAQFTLPEGTDPDREDAGKLSYALEGLPKNASFDPAGRILSWKPDFEQAGQYQAAYRVKDSGGLAAVQTVTLRVENVNRPPVFEGTGPQNGEENKTLQFTLKVIDPDKEDAGKIKYHSDNLPEGASLNGSTGEFRWTPSFEQSGAYPVRFAAMDAAGETAATEVVITIAGVNRPPRIEAPGSRSVREGETLRFNVSASDPDKEDAGKLQIEARNLPQGAQFASGEFTWTPGNNQQGNYSVEFIVKDPGGQTARTSVSIEVIDVPEEPQNP